MSLYLCRNAHITSRENAGLDCAQCRRNDRRRAAKALDVRVVERATGRLLPMPKDADTRESAAAALERLRKEAAARNAKAKAQLLKAGGARKTVNLRPEAAAALAEIQRLEQLDATAAIEEALIARASLLRRRAGLKAKP